jgi:MOSC domain-containing protein YiiM
MSNEVLGTKGMTIASIKGLYVGEVATFTAPDGRALRTGIRKQPVKSRRLELDGFLRDGCAEPDHRTRDKAVHLFSDEYYTIIEARVGSWLPRPAFGENISTTGIMDKDVCVGDLLSVGEAIICVTQPTERCRVIGRSLGRPKILKILHEAAICGFYARVIHPGEVWVDSAIFLRRRAQYDWTISRLHYFMFNQLSDDDLVDEVMTLAALSDEWKARVQVMHGRAKRGEPLSSNLVDLL